MRSRSRYESVVYALALVPISLGASIITALPASADCVNAGGSTICAQGTVTGGGPTPPKAGYYPSACYDPWYCDDGWGIDINIDRPDRPNGPGGGGGGNRPGGGGGGRPGGGGGRN